MKQNDSIQIDSMLVKQKQFISSLLMYRKSVGKVTVMNHNIKIHWASAKVIAVLHFHGENKVRWRARWKVRSLSILSYLLWCNRVLKVEMYVSEKDSLSCLGCFRVFKHHGLFKIQFKAKDLPKSQSRTQKVNSVHSRHEN